MHMYISEDSKESQCLMREVMFQTGTCVSPVGCWATERKSTGTKETEEGGYVALVI